MKFTLLKVKGNSMHPTLESGAFVLVWHSEWLFNRNKLFKRGTLTNFVAKRVPLPAGLQIATIALKVGDVVAVHHQQYGLIIKRVVKISNTLQSASVGDKNKDKDNYKNNHKNKEIEKKVNSDKSNISRFKSGSRKQQQTLVQFRLRGDNVKQSISENDMGWVNEDALIGKVVYIVKD